MSNLWRFLLPIKVEKAWIDTDAPYIQVGRMLWKDFKTLQKDMPHSYFLKMIVVMPESWERGQLNDAVMPCTQISDIQYILYIMCL